MRTISLLFAVAVVALGQTTPSITFITNSALPTLDPHVAVRLQPRSMATIFGQNLSTATASTTPPWKTALGGIELHFLPLSVGCGGNTAPKAGCDIVANLIYVSPTQINFLVPDISPSAYKQSELQLDAIIVQGGQRYDTGVALTLSSLGDFAVFQVGYDCDFSLSLVQSQNCGYSSTPGQNAVPLGAVTDASGNLVTSQNPIHQGQVIILWATGLSSMTLSQSTGLLQQNNPTPLTFGATQTNPAGSPPSFNFNWANQTPLWAGESPQYVGMDQINIQFPTCNGALATTEQRYNAAMTFMAHDNSGYPANAIATLYMPLLISPGEPTCSFGTPTTTTVTSDPNPASGIQALDFNVTVSPSNATGTITLSDAQGTLAISTLVGGKVTIPVYTSPTAGLTTGSYNVKATYNGSSTYLGSFASVNQTIQNPALTPTTTTLVSSVNPSSVGQLMTFTATVSPCCLPTGSVTFSFGNQSLNCSNSVSLNQGKVTCSASSIWSNTGTQQPGLGTGMYSVTATYSGDNAYAPSSSNTIKQVVQMATGKVALSPWTYRGGTGASEAALGEQVSFSANVNAVFTGNVALGQSVVPTGTLTFYDGSTVLGTFPISSAQAQLTTFTLPVGTHTIKATYSGDSNVSAAVSSPVTITIWNVSSFTATPNPSSVGQNVTFTLCGIPSNVTNGYVMFIIDNSPIPVRIAGPCTSDVVNWLIKGSHSVKVGLDDLQDRTTTTVTFPYSVIQVVN
jgi:uncharacterized protein (TIGR03437 family)